jgi:ribonuclease VapC
VVDTSAIMAMALEEPKAAMCAEALDRADGLLMSAVTKIELLVVANGRGIFAQVETLLAGLPIEIIAVTPVSVKGVVDTYRQWGKGIHPAALNICDCFALRWPRIKPARCCLWGMTLRRRMWLGFCEECLLIDSM